MPVRPAQHTVRGVCVCSPHTAPRPRCAPSVVWILQASHAEVGPPAKKTRNENPAPNKDAEQPSSNEMWSPPVSPIWFGPYRLYNSPSGKGSTSRSLCRTLRQIATPGAMTPVLPTMQPMPGAPQPIGPASSPIRPVRLVWGCSLAFSHFLAVTGGSSSTRPAPKGLGEPMTAAAVRRPDPVCPRRSSAAAVHLCTVSRRAPFRGMSSLALRWRAGARRAQKSLH